MGIDDYMEFLDRVAEPSNKVTQSIYRGLLNEIEQNSPNKAATSVTTLEENYILATRGMMFLPFNPFFEIYNEILGRLESNGFMEFWRQKYWPSEAIKHSDIGPQVLTMDHLMIGFLACLIPAVVSILVFIGEFIWSRTVIAFKKSVHRMIMKNQILMFNALRGSMQDFFYEPLNISPAVVSHEFVVDIEDLDDI